MKKQMTRAWTCERAGSLKRLKLTPAPLDTALSPQEVRISTRAVGLNFADLFALKGLYSATPQGPFVPGLEFAGVVTAAGEHVTRFHEGDAVLGVTRFGAYAEALDVPEDHCLKLPKGWSFAQGAAFPVAALTAWYALVDRAAASRGETALVHSAAGGVGLYAMAFCRHLGAHPIATIGSAEKRQVLEARGYRDIIVRGGDFARDLRRTLNGRPLDIVLDALGGRIQKESYQQLAPRGRLVCFGSAGFMTRAAGPGYMSAIANYLRRPTYDPLEMMTANRTVTGFNLIWLWEEAELLRSYLEECLAAAPEPPLVGRTVPFERAPEALSWLQSGRSVGKVVLTTRAVGESETPSQVEPSRAQESTSSGETQDPGTG